MKPIEKMYCALNLKRKPGLFVSVLLCCMMIYSCKISNSPDTSNSSVVVVEGEVKHPLRLSASDFQQMPMFFIKDVLLIKEKDICDQPEELIFGASYHGILLRDILLKAGMKYTRKWEPGAYIHVLGADGKEVVFSFGEVFYSSIGRSIMLALKKNDKPIKFTKGVGELIVSTDLRAGRRIPEVEKIIVERVDVTMHAYDDKKDDIVRPPTTFFDLQDRRTNRSMKIDLEFLKKYSLVNIPAAVMAGDCEGFRGIYGFEGTLLADLLTSFGFTACHQDYSRYVLVKSEDGFCATFSFGELFNSRLSNNIIIAYKRDQQKLDSKDGFAMSVAREDNLGGRSVKRIKKIEIF